MDSRLLLRGKVLPEFDEVCDTCRGKRGAAATDGEARDFTADDGWSAPASMTPNSLVDGEVFREVDKVLCLRLPTVDDVTFKGGEAATADERLEIRGILVGVSFE
jgi:hypothetical protein